MCASLCGRHAKRVDTPFGEGVLDSFGRFRQAAKTPLLPELQSFDNFLSSDPSMRRPNWNERYE